MKILNFGFIANLHEYIYASDLIISFAVRSTMYESMVSMVYSIPSVYTNNQQTKYLFM